MIANVRAASRPGAYPLMYPLILPNGPVLLRKAAQDLGNSGISLGATHNASQRLFLSKRINVVHTSNEMTTMFINDARTCHRKTHLRGRRVSNNRLLFTRCSLMARSNSFSPFCHFCQAATKGVTGTIPLIQIGRA